MILLLLLLDPVDQLYVLLIGILIAVLDYCVHFDSEFLSAVRRFVRVRTFALLKAIVNILLDFCSKS